MKKLILLFVLVVSSTVCLSQKDFKTLTLHVDTLQVMSWKKGSDFKTEKDNGAINYKHVWKTDCNIIINLVSKTVMTYYIPEKRVTEISKLVKFNKTSTSYFFEYSVDGFITNEKLLVCENEDGTFSAITQYAISQTDTIGGGHFDRNVKLSMK
jgi:hypothetical protein